MIKAIRRFIYWFEGFFGREAKCGVEVYERENGKTVLVLSELPDNPGTSVTNVVEKITTDLLRQLGNPTDYTVVERYAPDGRNAETLDVVTFRPGFKDPHWTRIDRSELEQLIESEYHGF